MARSAIKQKELRRQVCVSKHEQARRKLKEGLRKAWSDGDAKTVMALQTKLNKMPRDASKSRLSRRCRRTGRAHGNYRLVGVCRNEIYKLMGLGFLPGMMNSSW